MRGKAGFAPPPPRRIVCRRGGMARPEPSRRAMPPSCGIRSAGSLMRTQGKAGATAETPWNRTQRAFGAPQGLLMATEWRRLPPHAPASIRWPYRPFEASVRATTTTTGMASVAAALSPTAPLIHTMPAQQSASHRTSRHPELHQLHPLLAGLIYGSRLHVPDAARQNCFGGQAELCWG